MVHIVQRKHFFKIFKKLSKDIFRINVFSWKIAILNTQFRPVQVKIPKKIYRPQKIDAKVFELVVTQATSLLPDPL